jgi:membrane protein DedA with SNARE-associated domain
LFIEVVKTRSGGMAYEHLISDYGYFVILIWTFIEGETIVILAGVAAHLGYLELPWVIASALGGSFIGDQVWYYLGRHWGPKIIARRLSWEEGAEKVYAHLRRHQYWLILTFRFYYGLRNVTPFVVGSAHIPRLRFFALNLVGAVVWATVFSSAGYLFGEAFARLVDHYHRYALYLLGGMALVGGAIWFATLVRNRRHAMRHREAKASKPESE